ncbi:MAG: ATP-binding cassette domain-containing protein, partial [Planctomycetota bacterium]
EDVRIAEEALRQTEMLELADRRLGTLSGGEATILASLVATQGLAIVLATHDLNLAGQFCDRLLLLSEGQVARHGRPDEVLDPAVLESVYRVRFRTVAGADGGPRWVLPDSGDRIVARSAEKVP